MAPKNIFGFLARLGASGLAVVLALACAMSVAAGPATAGAAAKDMTVSARVIRNCNLATSASGRESGSLAAERMSATVTVNCSKSAPSTFAVSWSGDAGRSTIGAHAVSDRAGGYLGFVVYGDSSDKTVWNTPVGEAPSAPSQFRWVLFVY